VSNYDVVGTIAFFRERHRVESVTTASVLSALPPAELFYAPHPASSTAGATAWTIVRGLSVVQQLLKSTTATVSHENHPDHQTLMADFRAASDAITEVLLKLTQQDWAEERTVSSNDVTILHQPLGQILWLFHLDAIHHRGQLSTYLRPLGAAVPSIYGPSADQPGLPF
jgi:uncharacterized damage-inducible protein DinB